MENYSSLADDFYVNMNLSTEMDLAGSRETILHYAEQMQKKYPEMRNFYGRDKGDFVLEEDKDGGAYRWCSVEPRRVCSGYVNPPRTVDALTQHRHALDLAPYILSLSPLDCEALGVCPALERLSHMPGTTFINNEPTLTLSLDDDCRLQCRVGLETRTNAYQIRTGEYQEEQLSVYVTARKYGSLDASTTYVAAVDELSELACDLVENYVAEAVLEPLARTISLR